MKCPLLGLDLQDREWAHKAKQTDCLKEECAWWVDGEEGCLLLFIEKDLAGIWTLLTTIANKMPKEFEPRK